MAIGGTKRVFGQSKQGTTEGDPIGHTALGQSFLMNFPPPHPDASPSPNELVLCCCFLFVPLTYTFYMYSLLYIYRRGLETRVRRK